MVLSLSQGSLGMLNSYSLSSPCPWVLWLQIPGRYRRYKQWKQTSWFFFPLSEEEENVKQIKSCKHCLLVLALSLTPRCSRTGNTCIVKVTDVEWQLVQKKFLKNSSKYELKLWVLTRLPFFLHHMTLIIRLPNFIALLSLKLKSQFLALKCFQSLKKEGVI